MGPTGSCQCEVSWFTNNILKIFRRFLKKKKKNEDFPGGPLVGSPPTNASNEDSIPGLWASHMPPGSQGCASQLLRPCSRTQKM